MARVFDRTVFFAYVRKAPFGNRLTQEQIGGINRILDKWFAVHSAEDNRFLSYILATAFHETGGRMVPVREGFARTDAQARKILKDKKYARDLDGRSYYGRGLVQLTWHDNYRRMEQLTGIELVNSPDLALDPDLSIDILFEGLMLGASGRGDFTGKSLEQFFNETKDDPEGARAIVNGKDKAKLIASYHYNFLDSINAAYAPETAPEVNADDAKADGNNLATDKTVLGAIATAGAGSAATVIASIQNPYALAAFAVIAVGLVLVLTGRIELKNKAGA